MKNLWGIGKSYLLFLCLMAFETGMSFFVEEKTYFIASMVLFILAAAFTIIRLMGIQRELGKIIKNVGNSISSAGSKALSEMIIPVIISGEDDIILWYNTAFENVYENAENCIGIEMKEILGEKVLKRISNHKEAEISVADSHYKVYVTNVGNDNQRVFYFFDQTELKNVAKEYRLSRPAVALVEVDNIEEITKLVKDSEASSFKGAVRTIIEEWIPDQTCISRRISNGRTMIVMEERHLPKLLEDKFSILDKIRDIKMGELSGATLSIGIGHGGKNIAESTELATQALDMALSRGGDQAAVKGINNDFKFYGGMSEATEKRTKVKVRVIASALKELIINSDRVLIMGHKNSDFDAFGAAYALNCAALALGKESHIVMNAATTLAKPAIMRLKALDKPSYIISPDEAMEVLGENTLLIIADVHRAAFLDSPEVFENANQVAVIDHHRRSVDYISGAVLFYNESSASSTSEMVTELIQYLEPKCLNQASAEMLLSGIMLDTKNFVMHVGSRTFEALAYLRKKGADPVTVKGMFAGSLKISRLRSEVMSTAEQLDNCIIAFNRKTGDDARIVSSQAADELLNVEGVDASFVISEASGEVNVSARSNGNINVQVIMEFLGGGGHRTMAACQIKHLSLEDAARTVVKAINAYKNQMSQSDRKG